MKFCFVNATDLLDGIALVADELGITRCDGNADITVEVCKLDERMLSVSLDGKKANISYGDGRARFFRGLATLVGWLKAGDTKKSDREKPLFKTNGSMVDMSRNAVMNVETVKAMMRKMALMGMNVYMLYTEDTYEIEGRPYFGYMRGRYTHKELKELDAYAMKLGIELIPCIQMLGHLAAHLRWAAASPYRDTENTLLIGSEETYKLIEDMIKTVKECFISRRIHIGMDETHDLGLGKYLNLNGYRERQDIYFEHLEKVIKMVRAEGLEPMMWSDMFFRLAGKNLERFTDYDMRVEFTEEVISKIPKGIQQVFWDYYRSNEEFYDVNIKKHERVFGKGTVFAGGVWVWSGHCPIYSRSLEFTVPALDACKKNGVEEVLATVWHNGSESSVIMALAGLAWYADYDYKGGFDLESVKACFENSCGVSYDELMLCEILEHPDGAKISLTRAFLYNDPLVGLVDKHIDGLELHDFYVNVTKKLGAANGDKKLFAPAYNVIMKLSSLLENKADFGVRLKAAYDAGNKALLENMLKECDVILKKLTALRLSHRESWMKYNKPFGWEVHDIRYGGLIARFDTVKERLSSFLKGDIQQIEELEENRLRLDGKLGDGIEPRFDGNFMWIRYQRCATANMI